MPEIITKQFNIELKQLDEKEGTIRAILSSGMPDRQGEMVDQTSWNLDEYKKNPVVLWAHDHTQPAIAQALEIGVNSEGMLEALIKFAINEYGKAATIFKLITGKFIRAFSVGFKSEKVDEVNGIRILRDNTLYEFSVVNVGADALALAKTKGIDISSLEEKELNKKIDTENIEKEGRVLSTKNRGIIEKAKDALTEVLRADEDSRAGKDGKKKMNYKKILSKAIRELINIRNEK